MDHRHVHRIQSPWSVYWCDSLSIYHKQHVHNADNDAGEYLFFGRNFFSSFCRYERPSWMGDIPIWRWSIIARRFQKKGRVHNWHVSDSTHSQTSFRIAFISQNTSTESSPAEINCCVVFAKAKAATLLLQMNQWARVCEPAKYISKLIWNLLVSLKFINGATTAANIPNNHRLVARTAEQ